MNKLVKEKSITFTAIEIRAILDGRKTQARKVIKPQPPKDTEELSLVEYSTDSKRIGLWVAQGPTEWTMKCPYYPGLRLWAREPFYDRADYAVIGAYRDDRIVYVADAVKGGWRRHKSSHMPRWASRITLEVTLVRAEPLQEITEEGAMAEGVEECEKCKYSPWGRGAIDDPLSNAAGGRPWQQCFGGVCGGQSAKQEFEAQWHAIHRGRYPWEANPWVWVVSFKKLQESSENGR